MKPTPIDNKLESLRESVFDYMKENNLSYMEVSNRAKAGGFHIGPSVIMSFLRGEMKNPSVKFLEALAAGLGSSLGDIQSRKRLKP